MTEAMQFYEFNFDAGTVIEYERSGECNGCGMCCMRLIRWKGNHEKILSSSLDKSWDAGNGTRGLYPQKGVYTSVYVNGHWRHFRDIEIMPESGYVCPMLTADKRCKVHMGKRLISTAWPMSPHHVEALSECSYTFREIQRWPMSEWFPEAVIA